MEKTTDQMELERLEKEAKAQEEIIQDVRERYPDTSFPDVYRSPLWYGRSGKEPIEGYSALIGCIGEEEFVYANSISKEYLIVPHEVSIHQMEQRSKKVSGFGKPKVGVSLFKEGARMRARATFPEFLQEIAAGKKVAPRVDNWNSYDLSSMYRLAWGAVEQVCTNGMTAFRIKSTISEKHRQCLDVEGEVNSIAGGLEAFGEQIDEWRSWNKIRVAPPQIEEIMEALPFGSRHQEKILALPQTGSGITLEAEKVSLWDFHSIVTQFVSHELESEMVKVQKEREVAKVFHQFAGALRN